MLITTHFLTYTLQAFSMPIGSSPESFSRPRQGFRWVLGINDISAKEPGKMFYLGEGEHSKTARGITCKIEIKPHVIGGSSYAMEQKATLACGDYKSSLTCDFDNKTNPAVLKISKGSENKVVVFGCDNGFNYIPEREIFPGTTIQASSTLLVGEKNTDFKRRSTVPARVGQKYSWGILGNSDRKILKVRVELAHESPPKTWPPDVKISKDLKSAVYEKEYKPENGKLIIGEDYVFTAGDPTGFLHIKVFVENKFADEFWINFLKI